MNKISRHNYETFFLLYIDHELSCAEKKAVDEFVLSNPDLEEELVMLQQSKLPADHIIFEEKGRLLKDNIDFIATQQILLSHLDNELSPTEKIEIENLILASTDTANEWNLLQQTKLLADQAIVFEDKKSLYRKEKGLVVAFPWRRVLAAAVLIGFGTWGVLEYVNNTTKVGDVTIAKNIPKVSNNNLKQPDSIQQTTAIVPTVINEAAVRINEEITKKSTPGIANQTPKKVETNIVANTQIKTGGIIEKGNHLPIPNLENINSIGSNKTITANVTPQTQINTIVNPGNGHIAEKTVGQDAASNVYASTASLTDNSEVSDNHVLFMNEEKIRKTKLGGMFRKVKRVIERTTNIKSSDNSIRVANLEFAIQ